jgi:hypothetical protein
MIKRVVCFKQSFGNGRRTDKLGERVWQCNTAICIGKRILELLSALIDFYTAGVTSKCGFDAYVFMRVRIALLIVHAKKKRGHGTTNRTFSGLIGTKYHMHFTIFSKTQGSVEPRAPGP